MTTDSAGFPMVTAISQDTINYQISQLFKEGIVHQTLQVTMADTGISINATLTAPTIDVSVAGSMSTVIFNINMPSGSFTYYEGFGPNATQHVINFQNWVYAFDVNLNLQQIAQADVQSSTVVPPVVQQILQNFTADQFSISHLFMDFQNADIARYDPTRTTMPMPDGSTITPGQLTQWQNAIENYFTSLAGSANPYILGYAVAAHDANAAAGQSPLFNPTGATFSTYQGGTASWQRSLNFLLVTDNASMPAVPPNGALAASAISSQSYDGALVISPSLFLAGYVEGQVLPLVASALSLPAFTKAGAVYTSTSTWDNLTLNGGRGRIAGTDWPMNIYEEDRNTKAVVATLVPGATPSIHFAGSYTIQATFTEYPFNSRTWDGTVTTTQTWTLDLVIAAGIDGKLTVTPTFAAATPVQTQDENFVQKIFDVIASMGIGSVLLNSVGAWSAEVENSDFSFMESNLASALSNVGQRVILPAGDEFFFADATMLDDFGLRFDVQYKASH